MGVLGSISKTIGDWLHPDRAASRRVEKGLEEDDLEVAICDLDPRGRPEQYQEVVQWMAAKMGNPAASYKQVAPANAAELAAEHPGMSPASQQALHTALRRIGDWAKRGEAVSHLREVLTSHPQLDLTSLPGVLEPACNDGDRAASFKLEINRLALQTATKEPSTVLSSGDDARVKLALQSVEFARERRDYYNQLDDMGAMLQEFPDALGSIEGLEGRLQQRLRESQERWTGEHARLQGASDELESRLVTQPSPEARGGQSLEERNGYLIVGGVRVNKER